MNDNNINDSNIESLNNKTTTVQPETVTQPETTVVEQPVQPVETPVETTTNDNAVQPVVEQNNNDDKPKKNIAIPIIIVLIVLLVLVGAGIFVYFKFFRTVTGKEVVNGTINKVFENALKISDDIENEVEIDYKENIVKIDGFLKGSVESNNPEIKSSMIDLEKLSYNYDLRLDLKSLSGSLNLTPMNNNNGNNINLLLKDKNLYIKSNGLTKTYKFDMSNAVDWDSFDIDMIPNSRAKSISKILEKEKKFMIEAISDDYISQEKGSYEIDGVKFNGVKTTISMTEKQYRDYQDTMNRLKLNDEEYLTLYSSLELKSKEDIKEELNSKIEYNKTYNGDTDNRKEYDINIYTTNTGDFLGFEYYGYNYVTSYYKGQYNDSSNNVYSTSLTSIVKQNNIYRINIFNIDNKNDNAKTLLYTGDFNEKEKELKLTIKGYNSSSNAIGISSKDQYLTIKFTDNSTTFTYKYEDTTISLDYKHNKNNEKIDNNFKIGYNSNMGNDSLNMSLEYQQYISKTDSINAFDTSNAVDYNGLSDYDKSKADEEFMNFITPITGTNYTTTNTTYDEYDYSNDNNYNINYPSNNTSTFSTSTTSIQSVIEGYLKK